MSLTSRAAGLRALAVSTAKRNSAAARRPDDGEAGIQAPMRRSWFGLWGPAGHAGGHVAEDQRRRARKALADPAVTRAPHSPRGNDTHGHVARTVRRSSCAPSTTSTPGCSRRPASSRSSESNNATWRENENSAGAAGIGSCALPVWGQTYPNKPVRWLIISAHARQLHRHRGPRRRCEAAGNVGPAGRGGEPRRRGRLRSAQSSWCDAAPDGYTLLAELLGARREPRHLRQGLPYDTLKDFTNLALLGGGPNVLITSAPSQA